MITILNPSQASTHQVVFVSEKLTNSGEDVIDVVVETRCALITFSVGITHATGATAVGTQADSTDFPGTKTISFEVPGGGSVSVFAMGLVVDDGSSVSSGTSTTVSGEVK